MPRTRRGSRGSRGCVGKLWIIPFWGWEHVKMGKIQKTHDAWELKPWNYEVLIYANIIYSCNMQTLFHLVGDYRSTFPSTSQYQQAIWFIESMGPDQDKTTTHIRSRRRQLPKGQWPIQLPSALHHSYPLVFSIVACLKMPMYFDWFSHSNSQERSCLPMKTFHLSGDFPTVLALKSYRWDYFKYNLSYGRHFIPICNS